jgi:hypothetical protein
LKEIEKVMADIGSDENIKNSFLIQIYKSYYSAVVAEGMTFVVGKFWTIQAISRIRGRPR